MTETRTATHKITWFVVVDGQRIRRTSTMRGTWGYDVDCSCGQQTRTGGATRSHIEGRVYDHKHFDLDL